VLTIPPRVRRVLEALRAAGGRPLVVGGVVRDRLLGQDSKDLDIEVYGLGLEDVERVLSKFGAVDAVGRAFGVFRVHGLDIDFSLPRSDSKVGTGHRGFDVACDPTLPFEVASLRRDLTINSLGFDPFTGALLDPHGGQSDLTRRVLRATSAAHFAEDPLRALRAAGFAARFEFAADPALLALCRGLDLSELSPERIFNEWQKLLCKGRRPSLGLEFLRAAKLLPSELHALIDTPQDPQWHPEGDVWTHTCMVIDEAAKSRRGDEDDAPLLWGALCHDLGKPATTFRDEAGRIRSPGHSQAGLAICEAFLLRMRAPHALVEQVKALVHFHLEPALFARGQASDKAYRRLVRKLDEAGVSADLLARVATADHFGRTTEEALTRNFVAVEVFLERMRRLALDQGAPRDVVMGRHLLGRGLTPSPRYGEILRHCRDLQDETGCADAGEILRQAAERFPELRPKDFL
jgi:tRNA nucleotidyltransferase (CCA-adding enzyme)